MKINFNWGFGIAVTYTLFVVIVVAGVVYFMKQDVSLSTENYYTKGIKYQEQIEKINRTNELTEQLDISVAAEGIVIAFPKTFESFDLSGKISFYRPNDAAKDFTLDVTPDTTHSQFIASNSLDKGLWKIKVDWAAKGIEYYTEKLIMVN